MTRAVRQRAREALLIGETRESDQKRKLATEAARKRYAQLLQLEADYATAEGLAKSLIPAAAITALEAGDRSIAAARAAVDLDAMELEFAGAAEDLTIDGQPLLPGIRRVISPHVQDVVNGVVILCAMSFYGHVSREAT